MQPDPLHDDIQQARRGDRDALNRVLTAIQSRLRAAASSRLGVPLRAKMATSDLLQSTYVDVVRSIKDFAGDDAQTLVAWVTRIMENNLRDRLRFYGRQRRSPEVDQGEQPEVPGDINTPSVAVRPSRHVTRPRCTNSLRPTWLPVGVSGIAR